MSTSNNPYIDVCPIGCKSGFDLSDIVLSEGPMRRCKNCGQMVSSCSEAVFNNSMKEFDDPKGTWPSKKGIKRLLRRSKRIIVKAEDLLGKYRSNIHLLDIGCSSGAFVYAAKSLGVNAEGVEPSPYPVRTAIKHSLKVHQGFIEELHLHRESFDVATLFEVIEHLKDPLKLLLECHRLLCRGGLLIIKTGNTASWTAKYMKEHWEYFDISKHGGHISFFNPYSMNLLAEPSCFNVVQIKTKKVNFYQRGIIPYVFYRFTRIFAELLNLPCKWLNRGHEMSVFLKNRNIKQLL